MELAQEASEYDMPRILTGHFTIDVAKVGAERGIMLGRDVTVSLSTVADPAWDYVALGHIHRHQCLTDGRPDLPPVVYSGSLERIDFGEESDPKGFIWAEVERGRTRWTFNEVNCRPFMTLRVDVRRSSNPTQAVLDAIQRHDMQEAVVKVIVQADPEADGLLQDRVIMQALLEARVSHVAVIQRDVERPARLRLGGSPEGLLPDQLLERYLMTKEVSMERIGTLLEHARQIFDQDE